MGKTWKWSKPEEYVGDDLCNYGCEQLAHWKMKNGRLCCSSHNSQCPIVRHNRPQSQMMKSTEGQKKLQDQRMMKTGFATPFEDPAFLSRCNRIVHDRYGVENVFQADAVKAKSRSTLVQRYGKSNISQVSGIQEKKNASCLKNYGVLNPQQSSEVKQKVQATCLKRYGVPHPLQNLDIARKVLNHGFQRTTYYLPSGKSVVLSGYEPFVLDELLLQGFSERDFDFELNLPEIRYLASDGKMRRYYPDFYIPRLNWIIEVKSIYTYFKERRDVLAKMKACKDLGYAYNLLIRVIHPKLVLQQVLRHPNGSLRSGC